MRFSTLIAAFSIAVPAVMAAPTPQVENTNSTSALEKRDYPKVGFGTQLDLGTNFWVQWQDGKKACVGNAEKLRIKPQNYELSVTGGSPCDASPFTIAGHQMRFGGCGADNIPTTLLDANYNKIRDCKRYTYTIDCPSPLGLHDIAQMLRCNP